MRATVVVLPVPGPPATTASRRSTAAAAACFCFGVGILALEQPGDAGGEDVHPHGDVGGAGERLEVGRDLLLLAPVAVEVERAADELQGTIGPHQPARRDRARSSRTGSGHGSVARSIGSSTSTVAVSWIRSRSTKTWPMRGRAHGQSGGQHDGLVRLVDQRRRGGARRGRRRRRARPRR